jgi:thioredoxin reductase (NADPH)
VENFPGILDVTGPGLIDALQKQVERFGGVIAPGEGVSGIVRRDDGLLDVAVNGGEKTYRTRAVILAPGSEYRMLGVPGEDEMRQATKVSYCATCDGAFYRDKDILCVGGGNTAVEDTIYLATRFARKVTMVHRRREFRAQQVLVEELHKAAKEKGIDIRLPYVLKRIVGSADKSQIDHVEIENVETHETENLRVDGVFIFAGMTPNTGFLKGIVEMNENGYIACDPATLKTSLPGVFVAGDCRQQAAMQLATAVGDGVLAAMELKQYFRNPQSWRESMRGDGITHGW